MLAPLRSACASALALERRLRIHVLRRGLLREEALLGHDPGRLPPLGRGTSGARESRGERRLQMQRRATSDEGRARCNGSSLIRSWPCARRPPLPPMQSTPTAHAS